MQGVNIHYTHITKPRIVAINVDTGTSTAECMAPDLLDSYSLP